MRHLIWVTGLTLGVSVAAQAATDQQLAAEVADLYQACDDSAALILPLARSGLDLVPLYANGYEAETVVGSPFSEQGLDVVLRQPEGLQTQLADYMACETPIMRLTQGQALLAAAATETNAGSAMIAFYQHGWSAGADELRVNRPISNMADLSGSDIGVAPYGAGLDLLAEAVRSGREQAAGQWEAPTLVTSDTPGRTGEQDVDAFLVPSDAPGDEPVLLSSQSANRAVSGIYVVRQDYLEANRETIESLVTALFNAEEQVREDVTTQIVNWPAVADQLLGDPEAVETVQTLWRQVQTVGVQGNVDWARQDGSLRSFSRLNEEIATELQALGVLSETPTLTVAELDYGTLAEGIFDQRRAELSSFDPDAARALLSEQRKGGDIDGQTLVRFEIYFQPDQDHFSAQQYADDFAEVMDAAQRYGGALLTIEGHADPSLYLQRRSVGLPEQLLEQQRDNLLALSEARAESVRQSVLDFADDHEVRLDRSQLVSEGLGISDPTSGLCDGEPCPVSTEEERADNRRVVFRVVEIAAESEAFTPPTTW
jgi:outer membrane protein OmpA-like peptidoglycan-associated protein